MDKNNIGKLAITIGTTDRNDAIHILELSKILLHLGVAFSISSDDNSLEIEIYETKVKKSSRKKN